MPACRAPAVLIVEAPCLGQRFCDTGGVRDNPSLRQALTQELAIQLGQSLSKVEANC